MITGEQSIHSKDIQSAAMHGDLSVDMEAVRVNEHNF